MQRPVEVVQVRQKCEPVADQSFTMHAGRRIKQTLSQPGLSVIQFAADGLQQCVGNPLRGTAVSFRLWYCRRPDKAATVRLDHVQNGSH